MTIKEPMHPGKILKIIMESIYPDSKTISPIQRITDIPYDSLNELLDGSVDIDYLSAYRLGKSVEGTDMVFWLKLQNDYDDYIESSIEKGISESISQLEERLEKSRNWDFGRVFGESHFKEESDDGENCEQKSLFIKDFIRMLAYFEREVRISNKSNMEYIFKNFDGLRVMLETFEGCGANVLDHFTLVMNAMTVRVLKIND